MKVIRELIQKGDPRMSIKAPEAFKEFINLTAKRAKRSPQDEVIKRLAATMRHEEAYQSVSGLLQQYFKK